MTEKKQQTPEAIRERIVQLLQSKIIFDSKIARLEELRQANEAEINRLMKLL